MEKQLEENHELFSLIYTLELLQYKGISICETVDSSIRYLREWYLETKEYRYLELALLQMQACFEMGVVKKKELELYTEICQLANVTLKDLLKKKLYLSKEIKLNKSQVKGMIRRWKPSKNNPMTISEVVEDIITKVSEHKEGRYIYRYVKQRNSGNKDWMKEDLYILLINKSETVFFDVKNFICYTFRE